MFISVLFACAMTWIIPAGDFNYVKTEAGKVVDPNSFHFVENSAVNPLLIPKYIVGGFISSIDMGIMILFAGGAFGLVVGTGAIQSMMGKIVNKVSDKAVLFVPVMFVIFSLLMTTQTLKNFIAFAPIIVMICLAASAWATAPGLCRSSAPPWLRRSPAFPCSRDWDSVFSVSRRF